MKISKTLTTVGLCFFLTACGSSGAASTQSQEAEQTPEPSGNSGVNFENIAIELVSGEVDGAPAAVMKVTNNAGEPVYDLRVRFRAKSEEDAAKAVPLIFGEEQKETNESWFAFSWTSDLLLKPGESLTVPVMARFSGNMDQVLVPAEAADLLMANVIDFAAPHSETDNTYMKMTCDNQGGCINNPGGYEDLLWNTWNADGLKNVIEITDREYKMSYILTEDRVVGLITVYEADEAYMNAYIDKITEADPSLILFYEDTTQGTDQNGGYSSSLIGKHYGHNDGATELSIYLVEDMHILRIMANNAR